MAVTPKVLVQGVLLQDTPTLLYTVPADTSAVMRAITAANLDSGTHQLTVYLVPAGGSADPETTILPAIAITTAQTVIDDDVHVLEEGDMIWAKADVADVIALRVDGSLVT